MIFMIWASLGISMEQVEKLGQFLRCFAECHVILLCVAQNITRINLGCASRLLLYSRLHMYSRLLTHAMVAT